MEVTFLIVVSQFPQNLTFELNKGSPKEKKKKIVYIEVEERARKKINK